MTQRVRKPWGVAGVVLAVLLLAVSFMSLAWPHRTIRVGRVEIRAIPVSYWGFGGADAYMDDWRPGQDHFHRKVYRSRGYRCGVIEVCIRGELSPVKAA